MISMSTEPGKQLFWIGTSFIWVLLILIIDGKFYTTFSYFIYALMIVLLIGVLIAGKEIGGAKSWYALGSFSMQPSEFAKIGTLLALSKYLSTLNVNLELNETKFKALAIIIIPIFFIMLQPDAGSAIVFASLFLVLFREGLPSIYLVLIGLAIVLFLVTLTLNAQVAMVIVSSICILFAFLLKKNKKSIKPALLSFIFALAFIQSVGYLYSEILRPHQKNRIDLILGKIDDIHGAGYNLHQSKIAIGSGGFLGKGFLDGTQTKFNFVPEQSTDFIFCTIGEEWGFVGSVITIGLFLLLLFRIINIAERQRSTFSRVFGYGVASILFCHFFINIGMTIGLVPVIGIPLPFYSYGGSSLWGFSILLFIFIKLDAYRMDILR
jgi:rod shape determining protein RodA